MAEEFENYLSERLKDDPEIAAAYWKAERDDLAARIALVEALHRMSEECTAIQHTNPDAYCPDCSVVCECCGDLWPCATIKALRGESDA